MIPFIHRHFVVPAPAGPAPVAPAPRNLPPNPTISQHIYTQPITHINAQQNPHPAAAAAAVEPHLSEQQRRDRETLFSLLRANNKGGMQQLLRSILSPAFTVPPAEMLETQQPLLSPIAIASIPLMDRASKTTLLAAYLSLAISAAGDIHRAVAEKWGLVASVCDISINTICSTGRLRNVGGVGLSTAPGAKLSREAVFTPFLPPAWLPISSSFESSHNVTTLSTSLYQIFYSAAALAIGGPLSTHLLQACPGPIPDEVYCEYLDVEPWLARLFSQALAFRPEQRQLENAVAQFYDDLAAVNLQMVATVINRAFEIEQLLAKLEEGTQDAAAQPQPECQAPPKRKQLLSSYVKNYEKNFNNDSVN